MVFHLFGTLVLRRMDKRVEDILSDALEILGVEKVEDPAYVQYGPLILTVAPKVNSNHRG